MHKEETTTFETEKKTPSVMIVVEDSSFYAQLHQRNFKEIDVKTIILHGIGNFTEQIAKIKKNKNVIGVITDGLHGNWVAVHQAALKNGIKNIWLITGNQDMIENSKNYPYIKTINKATLNKNPNKYKILAKKIE